MIGLLRRAAMAACVLASAAIVPAHAEERANDWPNHPITLITPFAPGASIDGVSRIIAKGLSERLGQSVIVENKPGAGGSLGVQLVAQARPDGYTLGTAATGALTINPHVPDSGPPFDPLRSNSLIARLVSLPLVLAASEQSGIKSLADMLARARKNPKGVSVASPGKNTAQEMMIEKLRKQTGANLVEVPYRGSAPAVTDALAGQVEVVSVDLTSAYPQIRAGKLVALGVSPAAGTTLASDLPTIAATLPGFDQTSMLGLVGPAQLPAAIVARLDAALKDILAQPDVRRQLLALQVEPAYMDAAQFKQAVSDESAQWKTIIQSMNTK
jgi:tripartite-type tricarboxylate transporter receptor subunit TctC